MGFDQQHADFMISAIEESAMNCPSCGSDAQRSVMGDSNAKNASGTIALVPPLCTQPRLEVLKQVITDGIEKFIEVGQALKEIRIRTVQGRWLRPI